MGQIGIKWPETAIRVGVILHQGQAKIVTSELCLPPGKDTDNSQDKPSPNILLGNQELIPTGGFHGGFHPSSYTYF